MDIREYRVGFRQQAMSREEAQSSMFKMLQEAWEKNNGFDDEEWGETQSPPFILKRATDKKVWRGQTRVGGARQARARAPLRRLSFELCVTLCGSRRHGVCAVRRAPCAVRGARCTEARQTLTRLLSAPPCRSRTRWPKTRGLPALPEHNLPSSLPRMAWQASRTPLLHSLCICVLLSTFWLWTFLPRRRRKWRYFFWSA